MAYWRHPYILTLTPAKLRRHGSGCSTGVEQRSLAGAVVPDEFALTLCIKLLDQQSIYEFIRRQGSLPYQGKHSSYPSAESIASVIYEGKILFILYVCGSRQGTVVICLFKPVFLLKENAAPYASVLPFLI